ncbi:hypothetical protein A2U01_0059776, partial [Trifolium medium]|nr:hypothetical protein [Trifolium medium]
RMIKLQKSQKARKGSTSAAGDTRNEQPVSSGAGHAISSSSKPTASNTGSPVVTSHKRSRMETVIDLEGPDKKFVLPSCFGNRKIFVDDMALTVSPTETAIIRDFGVAGRRKMLAEDVAAL